MPNFELVPKIPLSLFTTRLGRSVPALIFVHSLILSKLENRKKPQKPLKIELSHHCQTTPTTARDSDNDDDKPLFLCSAFLEGNTQPKQQFQIQKFHYKATTR